MPARTIAESAFDQHTKVWLARIRDQATHMVSTNVGEITMPEEITSIMEAAILDLFQAGQKDHVQLRNYAFYCALEEARPSHRLYSSTALRR